MDVVCMRCGEPWDIDYIQHEAPELFARKGCVIQACPACQGQPVNLPTEHARRLAVIREIAGLWCEDLESLAYEINELEAYWNGELS